MKSLLIGLILISHARAATIGSAARSFPDTRDGIRIYADQLPERITDAQLRFVATHYVGSQKGTLSFVRRVRKLNPKFLMLHYQLAVGAGPAAFVVKDRWTNDFPQVTKHADWFLRDAKGRRLHQNAWDWYVMDIRFKGDRPASGFLSYWLHSAIQRMRENEDDGCFADSYTQDILMGQLQPPFDWFSSAESCAKNWLPQLNRFGAYCESGFHRQPERFYYLPNLGGLVTTWDRYTDLAVGDGGMNEGFCEAAPGTFYSTEDWKLQMSHLLKLANRKKIILCQTGANPASFDDRWFVVGSFLLAKGSRSYLNMIQRTSLEWYPEYDLDLGGYKEAPKTDAEDYWLAKWDVFRRDYEKGIVLVNPSSESVTIPNLEKSYLLVTAKGGGAVGSDGKSVGKLETTKVDDLTIPGHSARVLLNP